MHAIVFEVFDIQIRALSAATLSAGGEGALCVCIELWVSRNERTFHEHNSRIRDTHAFVAPSCTIQFYFGISFAHFNYIL